MDPTVEVVNEERTPLASEVAALRLFTLFAGFGAAFLAGRVAGRGGSRADQSVRRAVQSHTNDATRVAARVVTPPAFPLVYLPASLIVAELLQRREADKQRTVPLAAVVAFVVYHAMKPLVSRNRPPSQQGTRNFEHSFPSGHTAATAAIAIASAYVMRRELNAPLTPLVLLALGLPALVGASRMALDKHWLSDVAGGWATGAAVSGAVITRAATLELSANAQ